MLNARVGDWDGLWRQILLCCARRVPADVQDECQRELEDAGWDVAHEVLKTTMGMDRIPSNLLGCIHRLVSEERRRRYIRGVQGPSDRRADDVPKYDTRRVGYLMGEMLGAMYDAVHLGIITVRVSSVGRPFPAIDEWYAAGCSPTWSDYHDEFLLGYYKAWRREIDYGDVASVTNYLEACVVALRKRISAARQAA